MKLIKRVSIIILFTLLCLLASHTNSYADGYKAAVNLTNYPLGRGIEITQTTYDRRLICTQIEQSFRGGGTYQVRAYVEIKARKATGRYLNSQNQTKVISTAIDNKWNAVMAYFLNNSKRGVGMDKYGWTTGFHGQDDFCWSMWRILHSWRDNVGKQFNLASIIGNRGTSRPEGKSEDDPIRTAAEKYGNTIKQTITNKTGTIEIKKEVQVSGKNYNLVGPFNFTFNGKINSSGKIKVTNAQDTSIASTLSDAYDSNGTKTKALTSLKSGEEFYLLIPESIGNSFKLTVNAKLENAYGVRIVFMKHTGTNQNIAAYEPFKGDAPYNKTFNFNIKSTTLTIKKYAADTQKKVKLKGAQYNIYTDSNCTKQVGTTVTTGASGSISVKGLKAGNYYIKEIKAPNGYELTNEIKKAVLLSGKTTTIEFENIRDTTNLEGLVKVISDTNKKEKLEGMEFAIKYWEPDNKEYKVDGKREPQTTDSKYNVWHSSGYWTYKIVYKENADGNTIAVAVRDRWIDTSYNEFKAELYYADHAEWEDWYDNNQYYHRSLREYVANGISDKNGYVILSGDIRAGTYTLYEINSNNPYFNIRINGVDVKEKQITSGYRPGDKLVVENDRTFVDIEGFVFIDDIEGKDSHRDNLYSEGEGVNGVKVSLKRNGQVISTITSGTDSKGANIEEGGYKFWGDRNNLKIEVQYLSQYIIEFEYNGMKYESIPTLINEEDGSKAADTTESRDSLNQRYSTITKDSDVDYNRIDYKSETVYTPNEIYAQDKYHVIASTNNIYNLLNGYSPEKNEIAGINLGVVERAQPDLALVEDIDRVNMSVAGIGHTFLYNYRFEREYQYGLRYNEPSIKYENLYSSITYTRAIYPSDIYYTLGGAPESQKLDVRVIYKIGINNQSDTRISRVNTIKYYYDSRYEIISVGDLSGNHVVENNTKYQLGNQGNGYVEINTNIELQPQETTEGNISESIIYIELKVKESVYSELLNSSEPIHFQSVAEIASYTTIDRDTGKEIAGIDIDSAPDNVDINNIKTFEDDTDRAPGFCLTLQPNRYISGSVFEDSTPDEEKLNSGQERKGNGIFDEDEKIIEGVTVRLVDANTGAVVKTYGGSFIGNEASTVTDSEGNYQFIGVLPGSYKIEFIWGDETYLVQDYKSTIVEQKSYEAKLNGNGLWYNDSFKRRMDLFGIEWDREEGVEIRRSDAVDDQNIRKQIDEESKDLTNKIVNELKKGLSKMTSRTPTLKINYEYSETSSQTTDYGEEEYQRFSGNYAYKAYGYQNEAKSIDLGIVKRAKQDIELTKKIKRVTITLENGVTIIDAEVIKENGEYKLKNKVKNTVYIPASNANSGMVKMEMDNEIVQSATLKVLYEFTMKNIGEVEYLTEEYYNYGKVPESEDEREETVVKVKPESIIDYLDNANVVLQSENWEILEKPYKLVENGYIEEEIEESINQIPRVIQIKNILEEDDYLSPEGMKNSSTTVIQMLVSKLLATNEEIEIGNQAEIIQSAKTGGSILSSTPGNYNPVEGEKKEKDDSEAENVLVIPVTGENRYYVTKIIIGISSMLILGVGVILIRKLVK